MTNAQLIEEARRADQQWSHEEVLALCHALARALKETSEALSTAHKVFAAESDQLARLLAAAQAQVQALQAPRDKRGGLAMIRE